MTITILGSGTSHGIPVIGCDCPVCHSADPRDNRYRASALVRMDAGQNFLIDAGPEFRLQALRAGLSKLSAVLLSHSHADHIHGLDDLRALTETGSMKVYAQASCIAEIRERFPYMFRQYREGGGVPDLELREIEAEADDEGRFRVDGQIIQAIPIMHGSLPIFGYRIGGFAYLTDCSGIPQESYERLGGLDALVIDALRERPHSTHFSVSQALAACERIGAKKSYLTHICHEISHARVQELCRGAGLRGLAPEAVEAAFDGLAIHVGEA